MTVDLTTTNVLLGILATVSVLEALIVIGVFAGGYALAKRMMTLVERIEQAHVAPMTTRVNAILDDVKGVTACARNVTERTDRMAGWWRTFRGA